MKVIIGRKCVTTGHELDSVEKFSLWDWINSWALSVFPSLSHSHTYQLAGRKSE